MVLRVLLALSLLAGCATSGRRVGNCVESNPWCLAGTKRVCVRDDKGCETCSCQPFGTPAPAPR